MGVNCRIVKDNFDRVVGVLAPNGQSSILFNQALEYLTGKTLPSNINENSRTAKDGVNQLFEQTPQLAEIGTQEDYSEYLDTIFPQSVVRDVVYHLTKYNFDKFEKNPKVRNKTNTTGFHFIEGKAINDNYKNVFGQNVMSVVLDFRNPVQTDYDSSDENHISQKLEYLSDNNIKDFTTQKYDSGLINHNEGVEFVAFEPEQIHVLGTQDDVERFRKYKEGKRTISGNKVSEEEIQDALNIFGSAYTQDFQDFYTDEFFNTNYQTDINGEPVLEDVLTYLKSTEQNRLNEVAKMDFEDFKNQFPEMDYETLENKIYDAFLDQEGNFVLDEQKLRDSGIYESQEIDKILDDTDLQQTIKQNVLALNKETFINTQDDNFLNISVGEQYNSFGKLKTYDSYSLLRNILKNTIGAVTEEDFDSMLNQNVSEDVYNAIVDNEEMYNTLLSMSLNLKEIPVRTFENGSVVDVLDRDIFNELKDTLIVTNINQRALANISTLSQIDYDIMLENMDEVMELARGIEEGLISSNIDVIGLGNKLITDDVEKVQSFLRALNSFTNSINEGIVNDNVIGAFSEIYNDFFNIENRTDFIDIETSDYDIVRLDNRVSKLDAYANGYLRVKGNDYIRVLNAPYEDIVTSLIDSYEIGENILEGIVPNNLKSEQAYRNYINNIVNSRINSFGEEVSQNDLDAFRSVVLLEFLNGVEQDDLKDNFSDYVQTREELENKNLDYLTFDFASDLNNLILLSKFNEDPLYEKIFKYLEFKNGEVRIKENEDLITSRIQNILPSNNLVLNELKDYFTPSVIAEEADNNSLREMYFVNPTGLTFLNANYQISGEQVTTDITSDDFIRTKEGVFEKIDNVNGMNVYSRLINDNGFVRLASLNKQIEGENQVDNGVKFNNLYSEKQKGNLLDDINNCN